jgi:glycine/D-amino acid oxidase-like deaminating enzyme
MKETKPTWHDVLHDVKLHSKLEKNIACDVLVIGGGIAGATTAYLLAKAGKDVVLIEKGSLKDTVPSYTTAFLTSIIDTDLHDLEKMMKKGGVRKVISSGEEAIREVEKIINEENINCDFKRVPHFSFARTEDGLERFREDASLLQSLGFEAKMVAGFLFTFETLGAMEMKHQAKFHPMKYLLGLREAFLKYGGKIFENTEAEEILNRGNGMMKIVTTDALISAKYVVMATHSPMIRPWWYMLKQGTYESYICELQIPKGLIHEGLYEDDDNPYHYFRIDAGEGNSDRMIIGGEDHRTEIKISPDKSFGALKEYIDDLLPKVPYKIVREWSGPIIESTDGLPLIGRISKKHPNQFVATSFSGNGMTYGTLSGMLISDLILGRKNIYEKIYEPSRPFSLTDVLIKGRDYIGEFFSGAFANFFRRKN